MPNPPRDAISYNIYHRETHKNIINDQYDQYNQYIWRNNMSEKKITYQEGDTVRVLRGIIDNKDDPFFIYIKRRDGNVQINKKYIIKIENYIN